MTLPSPGVLWAELTLKYSVCWLLPLPAVGPAGWLVLRWGISSGCVTRSRAAKALTVSAVIVGADQAIQKDVGGKYSLWSERSSPCLQLRFGSLFC